jgi:hypothetical protein
VLSRFHEAGYTADLQGAGRPPERRERKADPVTELAARTLYLGTGGHSARRLANPGFGDVQVGRAHPDLGGEQQCARPGCAMGLRHPDIYGAVFCASPGAGYRPPAVMPSSLPRAYLVAGMQEPFFLENAIRWADALRDAGGALS